MELLATGHVTTWAAVHTRSRAEHKVAAGLARQGVPVFLPIVRKRRVYGTRVRVSQLPLFGGYLFYDFERLERIEVLRTYGVVRVLETPEPGRLAGELAALSVLLAKDGVVPERVDLGPPGTPVEVFQGPLVGTQGELVRVAGGTRLVLKIGFLHFGAAVEIDESCVRRIEAAPGGLASSRLDAGSLD